MHSGVVFIGFLCTVSWVIQLLPVISVPITGKRINYNLHFAISNDIAFGVFGVCDIASDDCSSVRVGYPVTLFLNDTAADLESNADGLSAIELPSHATYSVSKLLVVHLVAFILTSLLLATTSIFLLISMPEKWWPKYSLVHRLIGWLRGTNLTDVDDRGSMANTLRSVKRSKKSIARYLNWMLLFALLLFLLTLLAFLADILLFIPLLSYLGWIQLLPIMLMSLISSLLCFMRRSISSRRHLEAEVYPVDGVGGSKSPVRWVNDSDSDDGFYIYTNAFRGRPQQLTDDQNNELDETDIELHLIDVSSNLTHE